MKTARFLLHLAIGLSLAFLPACAVQTQGHVIPRRGLELGGQGKLKKSITVLLTGDSLMEAMGPELKTKLSGYSNLTLIPIGKKSTGLSRPDFYNWPRVLEEHLVSDRPDVVVMWVGTNDPQNIHGMTGLGEPCSKEWMKAYLGKLREIATLTSRYKAQLVLMGPPVMNKEPLDSQLFRINRLMAWFAPRVGARYVDTRAILADENGRYRQILKLPDGKTLPLRTPDQVHISHVGNDMVMKKLLPELSAACLAAMQSGAPYKIQRTQDYRR